MSLKRNIKIHLIDKLPKKFQLAIERSYLYYYYGDNYIGTEVKIFKELCKKSKVALDIGANYGVMTLFLSKFSSHVYCFEPLPRLAEHLNKKFFGCNISVENCALGDNEDVMYINIPSVGNNKFETRSSLVNTFEDEYILGEKVQNVEKIKVHVKRLDDFHIDNIGFIKIDVEGFEHQVLKGAKETIRDSMPIIFIEIERRHHKENNINDIFNYIMGLGYLGYFIYNKTLHDINDFNIGEMQDQRNEKNKSYVNNFIFSPYSIANLKI